LDEAATNKEVRWVSRKYFFVEGKSEYVGLLLKKLDEIQDQWLKEQIYLHQMKREGYIQCPWPQKLNEKNIESSD
jgi:hypothetical protein